MKTETTCTIDGVQYLRVRAIQRNNHGCEGCIAEAAGDERCAVLKKYSPEDDTYWCNHVVWIHDTPEARTEHAIKILEN